MAVRPLSEARRLWYAAYKEKHGISYTTAWRHRNPEAVARHCAEVKAYTQTPVGRAKNRVRVNAARRALRLTTFSHYGGSICACCGETEDAFLTLDHIATNGAVERRQIGGGHMIFTYLRREGYPPGYQVLCWNCNCGRHKNRGVCPHKTGSWE